MTNSPTAGEPPERNALYVQNDPPGRAVSVSISDIHTSESVPRRSDKAVNTNKAANTNKITNTNKVTTINNITSTNDITNLNNTAKADIPDAIDKTGRTGKPCRPGRPKKTDMAHETNKPGASDKAPREPPQINEFEFHLSARNLSDNTIVSYSYAIRQFFKLYGEITHSNLKLYKLFLIEHYKPMTVNLRIRALNSYIEYFQINSGRILRVRVQQKNYLDNVISEADYEYLKNCLLRDQKYLYYYIIRFMAATGARVSEVVQFTAEDIFAGHKDIYSKDNKIRRIYVPKMLQKDTLLWMKSISLEKGYIFLNRYGNPIKPGGIRYQLRNLAHLYGLNPDVVHPHSFRHRFAKSFIEKCGDLSLLSDLLGHKNLETTRIYLRRSSTEQYEIINKVVDW